jgi:hypothetical protein
MAEEARKSHPKHGAGPTPHKGRDQHGWSPDVEPSGPEQGNPSGHRSFHPDEHAPKTRRSRITEEDKEASLRDVPSETGESHTKRGEERGRSGDKSVRSTGRRGPSQRPSGARDEDSYGVGGPKRKTGKAK